MEYRWNAPKTFLHLIGAFCNAERWTGFVTSSVFWTFRHDPISQSALDCWWVSDSSVSMWIVSVISRCHQYSCCRFCSLRCLIESLARYRNNNSLYVCVYVRACARESLWSRVYITCQGWPQRCSRRRPFKVQVFGDAAERDRCSKICPEKRDTNSLIKVTRHSWMNRNK